MALPKAGLAAEVAILLARGPSAPRKWTKRCCEEACGATIPSPVACMNVDVSARW